MGKVELKDGGLYCNNTPIKLRFGLAVIEKFQKSHGFTLDQVLNNMPECLNANLLNVVDLMFDAIEYSHRRENIPMEVTWDDVEAMFSDSPGLRLAIIETWRDQSPPPADGKKKAEEAPVS